MATPNAGDLYRASRATRRRRTRALTAIGSIVVVALALLVGYALRVETSPTAAAADEQLRVVTTTNFLDDTVHRVGGDDVDTVPLMGPGVDPHLYQAKASDLEQMRAADAVFAVGLHLEGSLRTTLNSIADNKPVTFVGETLDEDKLLDPDADAPQGTEHDPHIWQDPQLWAEVVGTIGAELARLDPDNAEAYQHRASEYHEEILALHQELDETLRAIPDEHRTLVTSHDAFRYLGRAFDIDVAAIQGISTDEEAATADVARVADEIAARGVPAIFLETSVPRNTMDAVAAAVRQQGEDVDIGAELYGDAAGDSATAAGTYIGMLRANAEHIAEGLS